jgi:hypothetical protein
VFRSAILFGGGGVNSGHCTAICRADCGLVALEDDRPAKCIARWPRGMPKVQVLILECVV